MKAETLLALMAAVALSQEATDDVALPGNSIVPKIHREQMHHLNFIPRELEFDLQAMINDQVVYVTYDEFFTEDYLMALREEMLWIEENYDKDFIDSRIKRNSGDEVADGQYKDYHRISRVYWLTFLKKEHLP